VFKEEEIAQGGWWESLKPSRVSLSKGTRKKTGICDTEKSGAMGVMILFQVP